ncbi:BamA/TamA family outer membrane protein, partial [bacterium]|nr:BamA/TamA family outer membrane protein [bacterium]
GEKNLQQFFHQWLRTDAKCDYGIEEIREKEVTIVRYGRIAMPVEVSVIFKDGSEKRIRLDGEKRRETLRFHSKIRSVKVDPEERILDYRPRNNCYPPHVHTKVTPYYAAIYDIPVLNPSDSYSVVVGFPLNIYNVGFRTSGRRLYDQFTYLDLRYDFHHKWTWGSVSHQIEHLLGPETFLGFELYGGDSIDNEERVHGGKISLRKQLGPTIYAIDRITNDLTIFLDRNNEIDDDLEEQDETFLGLTYNFDSRLLGWDPLGGAKTSLTIGRAESFLGGKEEYNKGVLDLRSYLRLGRDDRMLALRQMVGLSNPPHKDLFKLGGMSTLRGYRDEKFKGGNFLLTNVEYRRPIISKRENPFLMRLVSFNELGGVLFFDIGRVWDEHYDEGDFESDVGIGFRAEMTLLAFFEKVITRLDIAFPTGDYSHPRVWLQMSHMF